LCGIRKEKFDIVKVEENKFLLQVEVFDKKLRKNISLVMVYGPAHGERREVFLAELAETCAKIKNPTLIGGDFNILRFSKEKIRNSSVINIRICLTTLSIHMS
jgi:hypothetical protein